MQNRRRSDKMVGPFGSFWVGGGVTLEEKARIAMPLVPIATGQVWAWMLQSGVVGAQAFLSVVVVLDPARRSRHCIHS